MSITSVAAPAGAAGTPISPRSCALSDRRCAASARVCTRVAASEILTVRERFTGGPLRGEPELAQRVPRGAGLVPGELLLADDDRSLVALPREEHRVARARAADRLAHRLGPIADDQVVLAGALARGGRAGLDLGEDRPRVLEARVLLGDHEEIRVPRRDLREARPLRTVALSGAPEDRDEATLRERAQQREHLVERFGRVRVV